ncbi:MAG TPA: hypothetical protein VJS44_08945 [Pyrinomonadaceae bacterium]|nr:hypothetical protein [Pyrinomonadaceae bacterium]
MMKSIQSALGLNELSLIYPAAVFEPSCYMPALRVAVCPVNRTALFIPNILAIEAYPIAFPQSGEPRCDIDVVRDKERLTRCQANNESLMPATIQVVRENARDDTFPFDLYIAYPVFEGPPDCTIIINYSLVLLRPLNGCRLIRLGGLKRGSASCPEQSAYDKRSNVNLFDIQFIPRNDSTTELTERRESTQLTTQEAA